jgi:hypothetical protein
MRKPHKNLSPGYDNNPYSRCYLAVLFDHHVLMMSFSAGHCVGILHGVTNKKKNLPPFVVDRVKKYLFPVVIRQNTRACYVVICVAMYVDEPEITLHFCSHSFRVTRELFPDIFFEGRAPPAPHFLNLCVGVSR